VGKAGLGTVLLKNQSGKFVVPTARSISAAASVLDPRTLPDERLSLVYAPGDQSYPLVNYEYAIVSTAWPEPAMGRRHRLFPAVVDRHRCGNAVKYLDAVGFIPLPDFIQAMSEKQIGRIK
jgi:phosphate transport system substrate-binding protein